MADEGIEKRGRKDDLSPESLKRRGSEPGGQGMGPRRSAEGQGAVNPGGDTSRVWDPTVQQGPQPWLRKKRPARRPGEMPRRQDDEDQEDVA